MKEELKREIARATVKKEEIKSDVDIKQERADSEESDEETFVAPIPIDLPKRKVVSALTKDRSITREIRMKSRPRK